MFKNTGGDRRYGLPTAQVEIGRQNDVDPYSFVSRLNHTTASAAALQRRLANLAEQAPFPLEAHQDKNREFQYQIFTTFDGKKPGTQIGYLNKSLNNDLFRVKDCLTNSNRSFRPPDYIKPIYLMGISTFAAPEDDPRLAEVHAPYSDTGIWLVPIVIGYPRVVFLRTRGRWHARS